MGTFFPTFGAKKYETKKNRFRRAATTSLQNAWTPSLDCLNVPFALRMGLITQAVSMSLVACFFSSTNSIAALANVLCEYYRLVRSDNCIHREGLYFPSLFNYASTDAAQPVYLRSHSSLCAEYKATGLLGCDARKEVGL